MKAIAVQVGKNIRDRRKQLDITQERLAAMAGIDRSYMGRIERGEVNITIDKLYKLAKILETPAPCLLP